MKNEEQDKNDIINGTKKKSENETWIIIGGEKKWCRICPRCKNIIYYSNKKILISN